MNAITYFKLNSPYEGDVTKNCALTGSEVDNNFYTLEGRDIKSVELVDGKVTINLMNGDKLSTDNITENCVKELEINFDETNGVLTIVKDGVTQEIGGFATNVNNAITISVDGTLMGNGLPDKPIGMSPVEKTGQYKPVKSIVDITKGEKLPALNFVYPGDRYLTVENVNEYGYLYNYEGLRKIACRLRETCSEWKIPTKQDWDDMLNAIEPRDEYKNHGDARTNKFLGGYAGKFLKSKDNWKPDDCSDTNDCNCNNDTTNNCYEQCACGRNTPCHPNYCGEYGTCHFRHKKDNNGIDKYGFNIVPSGYANEAMDYLYFKERAYFWTASNHEYRDAYIKAFAYNKSTVLQDILASDNYLSVRLVKDYNGSNFNENETILGSNYSTVMMPSEEKGRRIWTSVNLALPDCGCGCDCTYAVPNDGQGMDFVKKFFINQWNGKEWIRKELADGDSIVVTSDMTITEVPSDGNCNCGCHGDNEEITYVPNYKEYRVVNGELVDVESLIYERVIDSLSEKFDGIDANIEELGNKLQDEIDRSTAKDEEFEGRIAQNEANIQTLRTDLDNEIQRSTEKDAELEAKDAELQETIDGLAETVQEVKDKTDELETIVNELDGKVHVQEGTVFNTENGVLTLKSKDGTNDIEVQFNFNFGTF